MAKTTSPRPGRPSGATSDPERDAWLELVRKQHSKVSSGRPMWQWLKIGLIERDAGLPRGRLAAWWRRQTTSGPGSEVKLTRDQCCAWWPHIRSTLPKNFPPPPDYVAPEA